MSINVFHIIYVIFHISLVFNIFIFFCYFLVGLLLQTPLLRFLIVLSYFVSSAGRGSMKKLGEVSFVDVTLKLYFPKLLVCLF